MGTDQSAGFTGDISFSNESGDSINIATGSLTPNALAAEAYQSDFSIDFSSAKVDEGIGSVSVDGTDMSLAADTTFKSGIVGAQNAVDIDEAIAQIEDDAVQNRFQSTISNLSNISENVSAARSRVRDADFAAETAKLTQAQITQQASTTILAQANQRPQAALSLLG